jgi:uncharacterized phage protein gp47/JayE
MTDPLMPLLPENCGQECGCCEGVTAETPVVIYNRPGLSAIGYRAGTHSSFKETMLARISALGIEQFKTRDDDDFSISLMDGWATVADILTFYQERIANESYLRTATERVSLQELAKLIGYSLRPGLAAETYVALTLEQPPQLPAGVTLPASSTAGTPSVITLDTGVKIQSVPGPNQKSQIFETIESIEARIEWNALRPRLSKPIASSGSVVLAGSQTSLQVGDALLFDGSKVQSGPQLTRIVAIRIDSSANTTAVDLESPLALTAASPALAAGVPPAFPVPLTRDVARALAKGYAWTMADFVELANNQKWDLAALAAAIDSWGGYDPDASALTAYSMRVKAALFGNNAPRWDSLPATQRYTQQIYDYSDPTSPTPVSIPPAYPVDWDNDETTLGFWQTTTDVDLDNVYPTLVAGKWMYFEDEFESVAVATRITSSKELSRADFAITARVTQLFVDRPFDIQNARLRKAKVLGQSDQFTVKAPSTTATVSGSDIWLDQASLSLKVGQKIAFSGQPANQARPVTEVRTIGGVSLEDGYTHIQLDRALVYSYAADSVRINANVASASHGETKQEILGSGDASRSFQRFILKQPPLTFISAAATSGAASTLEIRVNDVRWQEVETLYGRGPDERVFVTRLDEDANNVVLFGDGATGARLPSGQDNVQAHYRQGLGAAGMVDANQLSQLSSRPLGLKEATNPLPASGGEDPETVGQSRANAPYSVRTLDRIVSLEDYADFARASAGIAKALVTLSWDGFAQAVFLTIAGPEGAQITADSQQYGNLLTAMQSSGDPHIALHIASYRPATFQVDAGVKTDLALDSGKVIAAVRQALRSYFSFGSRQFAQPVFLSEVVEVMQNVTGVIAVQVTALYRVGTTPAPTPPEWLTADPPVMSGNIPIGAELLTIDQGLLRGIGALP